MDNRLIEKAQFELRTFDRFSNKTCHDILSMLSSIQDSISKASHEYNKDHDPCGDLYTLILDIQNNLNTDFK